MSQDTSSRRYKLIRTLGKGSFSKVKEAAHIVTGELVAIKVLDKAMVTKEEDLMRIKREIKILKTAIHPNLISLYEIMETEKYYFFVMEHAAGGELSKYICDRGRLDEKRACQMFRQLIVAIEHLHKMGCAHRDIKPSNILLKENLDLKVIDFGLGNFYTGNEMLETPCGSPCYAAPELVTGKSYNGICVDIWSSGITLFAMMCGFLPFNDESRRELFRKIASCEYTMPEWLSPGAKDLLCNIFVANPKKRISIDQIKAHPWYSIYIEDAAKQLKLDQYATESEIVALTCHYMHLSEDILRSMIKENQANKYSCCFKLFMLKRDHQRLTKEDLQFLQQRRLEEVSTDLTLNRHRSEEIKVIEQGKIRQSRSTSRGQFKLPSLKEKDHNGAMTELLAKGMLKKAFVDRLRNTNKSRDSEKSSEKGSIGTQNRFTIRTNTEESHGRSSRSRSRGVRVERLSRPEEVFNTGWSRDESPVPTTAMIMKTDDSERRDVQRSRKVLRVASSQKNKAVLKPFGQTLRHQLDQVIARHRENSKKHLKINTTWDGSELSREQSRGKSRNSIMRMSHSVSKSKEGVSTPVNNQQDQKQLLNMKSMIKHIIQTGENAVSISRRDRSVERQTHKPNFFKAGNGPKKLNATIHRDASFTSQPVNHSILRSLVSPKASGLPKRRF